MKRVIDSCATENAKKLRLKVDDDEPTAVTSDHYFQRNSICNHNGGLVAVAASTSTNRAAEVGIKSPCQEVDLGYYLPIYTLIDSSSGNTANACNNPIIELNEEDDNIPSPPPPPKIRIPKKSSIPTLLKRAPFAIAIINDKTWWTREMTTLFTKHFLKVLDATEPEESINIDSTTIERDFLKICCSNDETKKWFMANVPSWTPWEDAKLEVFESLGNLVNFRIFIPSECETNAKSILERIEKQNKNLQTNQWLVRSCKMQTDRDRLTITGYSMLIGIDRESINVLRDQLDNKPFYCMTHINFRRARNRR